MTKSLRQIYQDQVESGALIADTAQRDAVDIFEQTRKKLLASKTANARGLSKLFKKPDSANAMGIYLWGGVGRGKSMLMDMFFEHTDIKQKRRVHFHAFMQEIHDALHKARQTGVKDAISPVAKDVANGVRLLCFDEMQITDITDAMIVGRLFEYLLASGVTIVATSNRPPDDLYRHGLNRQLFLPFIAMMKDSLTVHQLASDVDYRQDLMRGQKTYFAPLGDDTKVEMDRLWHELTEGRGEALTVHLKGRTLIVPAYYDRASRASFSDLCMLPLGPADYLALMQVTDILMLDNIPVLNRARNNEAKRFVTLIDTVYEANAQFICSAQADPDALYVDGTGAFEFERTASRLQEMQSADWGR